MAHAPHPHDQVHLDEASWTALAAHAELEGEVLLGFVTDAAAWVDDLRGPDAAPVRRVLDIGSGPGVGTCELARRFPEAHVVAVDGSPAMLDRATRRGAEAGYGDRISTHLAELPAGVDGLAPADLIWASMSLHHVGDVGAALRALGDRLAAGGLLVVAEVAEPTRVLPDPLDVGRPGLAGRMEDAEAEWFAALRAGLEGSVPSAGLPAMLTAAGLDVVASKIAHQHLDPPLSEAARRWVVDRITRARHQLEGRLDADDLAALDVLGDPDDRRSARHRPDLFVAASREVVVARRATMPR